MDMNKVEAVKVLTTLKAGSNVFLAGKIYKAPDIPRELLAEVKANSGTVEVLGVVFKETTPEPIVTMQDDTSRDIKVDGGFAELEEVLEDANYLGDIPESEDKPKKRGRPKVID